MKAGKEKFLIALFYPFTLVMLAAGFAAFFLLVLGFSPLLAATVALCFFSFSATVLYFVTKPAISSLGMRRVFLGFILTADVFAVLSLVALLITWIG